MDCSELSLSLYRRELVVCVAGIATKRPVMCKLSQVKVTAVM